MKIDWFAILYKIVKFINSTIKMFSGTKLGDIKKPDVKPNPVNPTPAPTPPPEPAVEFKDAYVQMLKLHNDMRKEGGLSELALDVEYCKVAQEHSDWMQKRERLSHRGFDARSNKLGAKAENIAVGGSSADDIFSMWKDSKGHKENIMLKDIKTVGFGDTEKDNYWTAIFG